MKIFGKKETVKSSNSGSSMDDLVFQHFRGNIHDNSNILFFTKLSLEGFLEKLRQEKSPHIEEVESLLVGLNQIHSSLRFLLLNLTSPRLNDLTLDEALTKYKELLGDRTTLFIDVDEKINQKPNIADAFFIISKEAITNAALHGKAKKITLKVKCTNSDTNLVINDNGEGFDVDNIKQGNGIHYIQTVVKSLGGQLSIISKIGSGTTINISIPKTEA